jgi:hypothetical protein
MKMTLTQREQKILSVAALIAVLMVLSYGVPALRAEHQQRAATIEQIKTDLERERRLIEDTELWYERRSSVELQRPELDNLVFSESATPLLTAAMQRQIRQYATEAGVTITSTRLAEAKESGGWIKVEQGLSFTLTDQNATLTFLNLLENSQPYLGVTKFTMRRARNQFSGELTVVGFARTTQSAGTGG